MDVLLENLWQLEPEDEPATLAEIAKRNKALHGPSPMSLNHWERAAALDKLEDGLDPFATERETAKLVASQSDINLNTNITMEKLLEHHGDEELIAVWKEFGE